MSYDPLLNKVVADYGKYFGVQGYAEGGNVPLHSANLSAYEEAVAKAKAAADAKALAAKDQINYRPGIEVIREGDKYIQNIPPSEDYMKYRSNYEAYVNAYNQAQKDYSKNARTVLVLNTNAKQKPYINQGYTMIQAGPEYSRFREPFNLYFTQSEPSWSGPSGEARLEFAYNPALYEFGKEGQPVSKKPELFGGSLAGMGSPFAGLGGTMDPFKLGSALKMFKGGRVKGYAEGDLVTGLGGYDPENPDFAGQVRENMNQNLLYNMREPVVPNVPVAAPVARPSAVEEALAQRRAIMTDLNKALTAAPATSGISDAEKYFRLAAAFGKTGKTGHFSESLASVGDTMAELQAEKRKEAKEQAAAGLQRLQARSELANQQYALAREGEMQDLLKKYINKGQGVTDQVTSGAADDGIPEDVKALILAQPTDKAVATIIDMAKEANKPSDLIRGVKFLVKQGAITAEEGSQIVKENLQGKLEQLDVTVPELGGTVKLTGPEARKYYDSGELPARFGVKPKSAAVTETVPTASTVRAAAPVMTQEQIEAKKTGMVEQSKKDIEASETLLSQKSFAKQQKDAANEVLGLVQKSPKAFGVISDPTWSNAVASLLETGVNTPFGSFGLAVEEPIAKIKLTGPEAASRQLAARPIALIEVGYRKMFLKGEGAVSNMEGALTKYLGPQLSDNPKVVQIKAGMIAIAADKQEKIVDAFERYKETNPEAGPRSFYQTPEYKRIVDSYETKYRSFAKKNGIPVNEEAGGAATKSSGSLVDRLKAERANRTR